MLKNKEYRMQSAKYVFGLRRRSLVWFLLSAVIATLATTVWYNTVRSQPANVPDIPLIFVARAHLSTHDPIFVNEVGPAGQFGPGLTKYAPGSRLVQRHPNGALAIYNLPGLVDVQSPDVNFAATHIIFAGTKTINPNHPDYGWRLYEVAVNDFAGNSLRQLTFSNRDFAIPNADQFGNQETYGRYHDLFPAYLADGRIAFVSSRYPSRANYDQRTTFNLYILGINEETLRRVTTDRGGVLHPTPLPDGRILVARWWNQFNQPSDTGVYNRIDNSDNGVWLPDGTYILPNPDAPFNPARAILPGGFQVREAPNTWHLMTVNPDGTDFQRLAWTPRYLQYMTDDSGHFDTYHAAQPAVILQNGQPNDYLIAYTSQQNSTMVHSTLETGVRIAYPGLDMMYANATEAIAGLTYDKAWGQGDTSGPYALHPWGLPDGRILYSQSSQDNGLPTSGSYEDNGQTFALQGSNLRYRLYAMQTDGGGQTLIPIDLHSLGLGTADIMDAKPIAARVGWAALSDDFTMTAADAPALWNAPNSLPPYAFSSLGPNDIETSVIHNPNVYANPSLRAPFINNSPPPGSVAWAELWLDANQFTGAFCYPPGYPQPCDNFQQDTQLRAVLWDTVPVTLSGAFTVTAPADVMGFIILRDETGRLVRNWNRGYASIAQGSSWSRPGETVVCTGCHLGHVSGTLDDVMEMAQAGWQNVAPYAAARASSHYQTAQDFFIPAKINDRRGWLPVVANGPQTAPYYDYPYTVGYQDATTGWISDPAAGPAAGQWVELAWPAAQRVSQIRLVAPPRRGDYCDAGEYCGGGDWGGFGLPEQYGEYVVAAATLRLYHRDNLVESIAVGQILPLSEGGTLLELAAPLEIDRLRLTIEQVNGRWHWNQVAALNEIEVVGQAAEPWPLFEPMSHKIFLSFLQR
jgi:hypothetical protein